MAMSMDVNTAHTEDWWRLNYQHQSCYFCCGFYGPCFGEPVCPTCHAFLYPEDVNVSDERALFLEKTDDGDSGNDEPTDFSCSQRKSSRVMFLVPKTDKIAEKIALLTIPREKDIVPEGLIHRLPPEVLLVVFSYLDDLSLWSVGQVCKRWLHLLDGATTQEHWRHFTYRRWPLYRPLYRVHCWRSIYQGLIKSVACRLCLHQMSILKTMMPLENNRWRSNRLQHELKNLQADPPEGIEAIPLDSECCHWQASITGPTGSPYEGGIFFLFVQIPNSYPLSPPIVRFITKVFHPNVSRHGDIGIDSIHHNWSLALTLSKVLISIQSLLTDPYCQVCMEPEIGKLYQGNRVTFERIARLWTWRFAMTDGTPIKSLDTVWDSLESG